MLVQVGQSCSMLVLLFNGDLILFQAGPTMIHAGHYFFTLASCYPSWFNQIHHHPRQFSSITTSGHHPQNDNQINASP
jgi:hypothetical protein